MELIVDGQRATLAQYCVCLPERDLGWFQRSRTDCLRAAVATVLQVPYEELPEFRDDVELEIWAGERGYRLRRFVWSGERERRWIGVSPPGEDGARHTLVMAHGAVYHDPASGWEFEGGRRAPPVEWLDYGIALEPGC